MKRRQDHYAKLAKEKGYLARSVFKLEEIQKRFQIIRPGLRILEIGSAPGSWSRYALKLLGGRGNLIALDKTEPGFKPRTDKNYRFIRGDLFSPEAGEICAGLGPYDLVLSDAAPATSGNSTVDTQASLEIGFRVLELASNSLKEGGCLVVKIFQGGEEGELLKNLKSRFERARAFKPAASRKESREVFFIGFSLRGLPG